MYCWNCGARNSDDNSFCGKCGKRIASARTAESSAPPSAPPNGQEIPDVAPVQANPLVEEPRVVHDSQRTLAQMEIAPPQNVAPKAPTSEKLEPITPERTIPAPVVINRRTSLPPNRITGPSFLGLSDDASTSNGSEYLLDDEQPHRFSWRAWLAVAVLAVVGFLIYKQWSAIQAGAQALTQKADATENKPSPVTTPPAASTSAQNTPPSDTTITPQPSTNNADGSSTVDKPENDQGTTADGETAPVEKSADETDAVKTDQTATSEDEPKPDTAEDTVTTAKEQSPAPAKTKTTTAAATTQAKFDNSSVDQADRYLHGQGVPRDCTKAISLLRSSARDGNPRAQVKLGAMYAIGECVTQDRAAAYQWMARAQETQPSNSYLQKTMNNLWANMTPDERDRITK